MSTPVVGTCTDCIVSLPEAPSPNSLRLQVTVGNCYNLILKNFGTFVSNYPAAALTQEFIRLAPGGSYAGAIPFKVLFLYTTNPVQVTVTVAGVTFTYTVNNLLVLDTGYDSMTVTNLSGQTQNAEVSMCFAS